MGYTTIEQFNLYEVMKLKSKLRPAVTFHNIPECINNRKKVQD